MKITTLLFTFLACFLSALTVAQETPREIIIGEIIQALSPAIDPVIQPVEEQTEEQILAPPLLPESIVEPPIEEITPEEIIAESTEITETIADEIPVDIDTKAIFETGTTVLPEEISPQRDQQILPPQIAAFYLSTEEYLTMRGTDKASQLTLTYDVSVQKKDMILPVTSQIQIILGHDYGAIKNTSANGGAITKIYDFRFNRLLTISEKLSKNQVGINFDNISLYAPIYRNITTVRRATQNGKLKTIILGGGKKLEAFWVESAMGWTISSSTPKLKIKKNKSTLTVNKDKKTIFEVKFSKDGFTNDNFKQVLRRLATHEWPIHPHVLEMFAAYTSPPENFKILSYNPGALKGETQTWKLVDRQEADAEFPLPSTALSISQRQPLAPIVFIIGQAARGQAFDGPQTETELENDFEAADKSGDSKALWLIGQRYNSYTGKCDQESETWLCTHLETLETTYGGKDGASPPDPKLAKFIQGVRIAKQGEDRVKALKILQPFLSEPDVPAIILQTAGMARAKIKPSDIVTPMTASLSAENLLQSALAKDPYDPNTYVGLAQINAANEAYEASWDYYDALRARTVTSAPGELKIDKVEEKLRSQAPMYFLEN